MNNFVIEKEYADRCCQLYELYDEFNRTNKTRKRKSLIRKMFNYWYKCPSPNGEYNELYWQYPTSVNGEPFRIWFWDHSKILYLSQYTKMFKELVKRINKK